MAIFNWIMVLGKEWRSKGKKNRGVIFRFRGSFRGFLSDECSAFASGLFQKLFAGYIVVIAYMLIAWRMAGLGFFKCRKFKRFRQLGKQSVRGGLIGFGLLIGSWIRSVVAAWFYVVEEKAVPERYLGTAFSYDYSTLRLSDICR